MVAMVIAAPIAALPLLMGLEWLEARLLPNVEEQRADGRAGSAH